MGINTVDDAAVYKISDDNAMIQTLDFFTPIVDDPYMFGQIAAANALSDVYAMGGDPKVALNIVGFPNCLDIEVLGEILRGGADKVKESGAILAGGHSIQDDEPKYGLSVSGFVHPDKIWRNYGCNTGDVLILTKQIGNGIVNTAIKADMASESLTQCVQKVMAELNKKAKQVAENYPISACTDITGFGLLGHLMEMAQASKVKMEINVFDVPMFSEALTFAEMGLVPEGTYKNRAHIEEHIDYGTTARSYIDVLHDPQTSGGLLFSIDAQYADAVIKRLKSADMESDFAIIGKVISDVSSDDSNYIQLR